MDDANDNIRILAANVSSTFMNYAHEIQDEEIQLSDAELIYLYQKIKIHQDDTNPELQVFLILTNYRLLWHNFVKKRLESFLMAVKSIILTRKMRMIKIFKT
jgi:hypothetical protein